MSQGHCRSCCRVTSLKPWLVFIQVKLPNANVSHDPNTGSAPMGPEGKMAPLLSSPRELGSLKLSYSLLLTLPSSFPSAAY